jgi:glycosyltransferase involved in cell wall biosynthesis
LIRVFVLLPRHLDVVAWQARFVRGEVPDRTPYGYHFAEELGASVTFSVPTPTPSGVLGLLDKAFKRLLGFDLRHTWRNRQAVFDGRFDVVWTHTEYEHLAVAMLRKLFSKQGVPIVAQSVWLMDEWSRFFWVKRTILRWLLKSTDVATFHSPLNLALAKQIGIASRQELVRFGISLDSYPLCEPVSRFAAGTRPIRVLTLGNDRHRDWSTLFAALGKVDDFELRIGSSTWPKAYGGKNIQSGPMTQSEVQAAYAWADCVVIPLKRNLHVSGLTTILESVALGLPVLATATGGMEAYFDSTAISYVPQGDQNALREAIINLSAHADKALLMAQNAQRQFVKLDLSTRGFAYRHMAISYELLGKTELEFNLVV